MDIALNTRNNREWGGRREVLSENRPIFPPSCLREQRILGLSRFRNFVAKVLSIEMEISRRRRYSKFSIGNSSEITFYRGNSFRAAPGLACINNAFMGRGAHRVTPKSAVRLDFSRCGPTVCVCVCGTTRIEKPRFFFFSLSRFFSIFRKVGISTLRIETYLETIK